MSGDTKHLYRSSLTGQITEMTEDAASVFPDYLEQVAPGTKPYLPEMFKPGKLGEFDNPEPPTDAEITAQAELDETLEDNAPNSKAAREAKARLKEAEEAAETERLAVEAQTTKQEGSGS